jgi:outer membrane protein assembly factor BamE
MHLDVRPGRGAERRRQRAIRYDDRMRIIPLFALVVALALGSGGCVYRLAIQQGNYLDPAVIAQVKAGMTHSQVRYLMGTPMVPGGFDDSRWDYDYYFKTRRLEHPVRAHAVVYFENNLVARVDSNVTRAPFAPPPLKDIAAPEPHNARH